MKSLEVRSISNQNSGERIVVFDSLSHVRVGFRQNGFFADFFLGRRVFSRILSPDYFASFLWGKSAQKNPPGKSLAKSSKFYTTKIPGTFLQRGQVNTCVSRGSPWGLSVGFSLGLSESIGEGRFKTCLLGRFGCDPSVA